MSLPSWLFHSLLTMFLWGIWGFLGKVASRSIVPQNLVLLSLLGWIITFPVLFLLYGQHFKVDWHSTDFYYAVLSGILGSLGSIFFFQAFAHGEASRVVAVTALYPLVTVVLAYFFLQESLTLQRIAGILFALVSIYLLSV